MKKFRYRRQVLLTLTAFMMAITMTGCGAAKASFSDINLFSMAENSDASNKDSNSVPHEVVGKKSSVPNTAVTGEGESAFASDETDDSSTKNMGAQIADPDNTPPVIDAQDQTISYGTYLYLKDIASISDDMDESPVLEITSVQSNNGENADNSANSAEKAFSSATAITDSTVAAVSLVAAADDPNDTKYDNETSALSNSTSDESVSLTASSTTAATETESETALAENTDENNSDSKAAETIIDSSNEQSDIGSAGSTSAAESEPDEINKSKDGYLFSSPGSYIMNLTGTDRSGNQSQKSVNFTVIDSIAPVFSGLSEGYTLTDKDAGPPDYMEGISATDEIDGNLSESIKVDDSKVQYGTVGTYSIEYSVSDLSGNPADAAVPVVIKDTTAPEIILSQEALNLFVTDAKPDYAVYVNAKDTTDGDVKASLTVDDTSVKYSYPGTYAAILCVQDKSGNKAEKNITINVSAGWKTKGEKTYYYSPEDGRMVHNWKTVDGKKYYFDPDDGHVRHGWRTIDGKKYYLDQSDGHMLTGLQIINDKKYLLDSKDGHQLTGWQTIDGKTYYFDPEDGHMRHGWRTIDNQIFYFDPDDGHVRHGWRTIDGKKYYLDQNDGHMLTGLQTINGKHYLLDSTDGHQLTGWQTIGSNQYYFDPEDGHMRHNWVNINGSKYYFDPGEGFMYTGTHYIDGNQYDFGTNGIAEKVVVQQRSSVTSTNSTDNYSETAYIGNRNSRIFHHSWCASVRKMSNHNKVGFGSRDDAVGSGYRPCKNCNP